MVLNRFLILIFFSITPAFASSFIECFVDAEILEIKSSKKVEIRIAKVTPIQTGFGHCSIDKGKKTIELKNSEELKKGQKLKFKYHSYSGMGEKGPVTGEVWEVVSKKDAP